jgi:hypothetical protein
MANVFTLVYLLENLEEDENELINVEEIFDIDNISIGEISRILNQCEVNVKPGLVNNILKRTSII